MDLALSVLALLLVAVTMGLSLAHALEFPGKKRLDEKQYRTVQAIYYPGFTIGGMVGEFGGLLLLIALLFITPPDSDQFRWTAAALTFIAAAHLVFWLVTQPTNKAWLKDTSLSGAGRMFFGLGSNASADWQHMRTVWEWSHVARAGLCMVALACMAISLTRIQ
jgi:hypothetical protein